MTKFTWNYRILRVPFAGNNDNENVYYYNVVEAHYIDGNLSSCTSKGTELSYFDDIENIKWIAKHLKDALKKPLIEFNNQGKLVEVTNESESKTPSNN